VTQSAAQLIPPTAEPELPVLEGQVIAERYRIGRVIGEGGMGVVCEAIHVGLGTPVAIKVIRSDLKHDPDAVTRFFNEARTAASLKGEHIARVYDVGQLSSGEPYLVMERLEGKSLDLLIAERGRVSPPEAVDLVLQACEGLSEAHAVALVHRDIKPGNLFLAQRPDGQATVKILDFGISKRLVDDARRHLTDPGRSMGSPWYMSPEQMMNPTAVEQRADVWSLGVLLFELLTNETPFNGDTVVQVCAAVLTHTAPTPSSLCPDLDPALDSIVMRCLEKEPSERFPTVLALAEALRPFSSNPLATTAPTPALSEMLEPVGGDSAPEPRAPRASDELVLEPVGFHAPASASRQRAWTPLSTRAVHGTGPTRAREFATSESLSPVTKQDLPMRRGWSRGLTIGVSLAAGVALAWLALPLLQQNFGVPTWAELERQPLPNEPTLASGPEPEPARFESLTPRVPEIEAILVANGAPNPLPRGATAAAPASPQRVAERRAAEERYERWLSEHNLIRRGSAGDSTVSPPPPSAATPPAATVEPAPSPSPTPSPVNDPYGLEPTAPKNDPYPAPSPNPTRPTDRSDLQEPYP